MRKNTVGIAAELASAPTNADLPTSIDRDAFARCAMAHYEEILSGATPREIEATEFVDLAWRYFIAGFGVATRSEPGHTSAPANGAEGADARSDSIARMLGESPGVRPTAKSSTPMDAEPRDPLAEMVAALSSRRLEVLRLVARGLTNREIAEVLCISNSTVKSHLAAVFESLDVTNRTEAAYALQCYEEAHLAIDAL